MSLRQAGFTSGQLLIIKAKHILLWDSHSDTWPNGLGMCTGSVPCAGVTSACRAGVSEWGARNALQRA